MRLFFVVLLDALNIKIERSTEIWKLYGVSTLEDWEKFGKVPWTQTLT